MWNPYAEGLGAERSESPIINKKSLQPTVVCSCAVIVVIVDEQLVACEQTKEWRILKGHFSARFSFMRLGDINLNAPDLKQYLRK